MLDGQQGAKDAFMFLDELARVFSGAQKNSFKITTKWDGAPAVFCGTHPDTKKFFEDQNLYSMSMQKLIIQKRT